MYQTTNRGPIQFMEITWFSVFFPSHILMCICCISLYFSRNEKKNYIYCKLNWIPISYERLLWQHIHNWSNNQSGVYRLSCAPPDPCDHLRIEVRRFGMTVCILTRAYIVYAQSSLVYLRLRVALTCGDISEQTEAPHSFYFSLFISTLTYEVCTELCHSIFESSRYFTIWVNIIYLSQNLLIF